MHGHMNVKYNNNNDGQDFTPCIMESRNNNRLLTCRTDRIVAVYIFTNKSAFTVASIPGPRQSAEKWNDQVTDFSYTFFFSTNGTQSQKRSPSFSQTLSIKSVCTVYGINLKSYTR